MSQVRIVFTEELLQKLFPPREVISDRQIPCPEGTWESCIFKLLLKWDFLCNELFES